MAVNGIGGINLVSAPSTLGINKMQDEDAGTINFGDFLKQAMANVSNLENQANQLKENFAVGKIDNIHQVMIAAEKADIALQFTMQIRNKIMDAYSEIMRMQI